MFFLSKARLEQKIDERVALGFAEKAWKLDRRLDLLEGLINNVCRSNCDHRIALRELGVKDF